MKIRGSWLRLLGLVLLGILLWQVDVSRVASFVAKASPAFLLAAVILNIPQITLKAIRWRALLRAHAIEYGAVPAILSYFGSIFVGLLTPGRLGEFVKALHVKQDCDVPVGRAMSSVLVDRIFDLYALLLFGGAALLSTAQGRKSGWLLAESAAVLILPMVLFLNDRSFHAFQDLVSRMGKWTARVFREGSWLLELRTYLKSLKIATVSLAILLTAAAYFLFFTQCFLIARSLELQVGPLPISFAVALGSLVTLIPVSISGLGTREAVMIGYLSTTGVPAEQSLGFSLLVFVVFYIAGALLGAIAWMIKPASWSEVKSSQS